MTNFDLFILGAGELGTRVVRLWRAQFPQARIVAETLTPNRHSALSALAAIPRCKGDALDRTFPFVLVALPPSSNESYTKEVGRGAKAWDGTGCLLHISSTGVYAEENGGWVDESSAVGTTERAQLLVEAEAEIQKQGGTLLRLAGLYSQAKGPHLYYQRQESSPLNGEAWINLIHYDDAASLAVAILKKQLRGIFLGCEDAPLQRKDMVAAVKPNFEFTGTTGPLGKRCRNQKTRSRSGWTPQKTFS